jgi:hypothetical protein
VAETVSAVVGEILAQGSFDLTSAEALAILNRRHKQMCNRARVYRSQAAMTRADPDVAVYASAAGLVEPLAMHALEGTATDPVSVTTYSPGKRTDVPSMLAGVISLSDSDGGVFAEYNGATSWLLYPDPSDLTVYAYGVYSPTDLLINDTVPFRVDDDAIEGLMAGVFATALRRPGEARPDLATDQEAIFSAACEELRQRSSRRSRGPGPAQIRVQGVNG